MLLDKEAPIEILLAKNPCSVNGSPHDLTSFGVLPPPGGSFSEALGVGATEAAKPTGSLLHNSHARSMTC
jgi:hypothetical protein